MQEIDIWMDILRSAYFEVFRHEFDGRERGNDAACVSHGYDCSFHRNRLEIIFPSTQSSTGSMQLDSFTMKTNLRVIPDAIIDSLHTTTAGKFQNLLGDVLLSIKDDMVRTILFC